MTRSRTAMLALSLLIPFSGSNAYAWGDRGHSIVAEIAMRHLSPKAAAAVREVLGSESMASVASWADDYKNTPEGKATKPWHYVDIDIARDRYSADDCSRDGCLVTAMTDLASNITDTSRDPATRRKDLLLLIHLVGDSTQPLHCGEKNGDGGGNTISVMMELNAPDQHALPIGTVPLHAVWDDYLVGAAEWSWGAYVQRLEDHVVPGIATPPTDAKFASEWIDECHAVTQAVYRLTPPAAADGKIHIGPDYQSAVHAILDKQLATGGLRLAALLNAKLAK
ncbi:S1/P1 nuclease [Rhizobium sp. P38BS-XIX]|uniref:S1/P1 nuclease n=1 Tax=Rhizobium sp. P38BS-XIX TaxID=2726740 RepID=UPI001457850F|nr:S1/P1 nuclease [Rhizobium sp. P38BS-XIX]NLR97618.1 S1/P1 nuclease [Rhizobium sp. P38BS-XIX]